MDASQLTDKIEQAKRDRDAAVLRYTDLCNVLVGEINKLHERGASQAEIDAAREALHRLGQERDSVIAARQQEVADLSSQFLAAMKAPGASVESEPAPVAAPRGIVWGETITTTGHFPSYAELFMAAGSAAQPQPAAELLLVTTNETEAAAVRNVFSAAGMPWQRCNISGKTYFDLGKVGNAKVLMVQSEPGSNAALLTTHNAIEALRPTAAIMVGFAFGTQSDKHTLGDILVSQRLSLYGPRKIMGPDNAIPRGDRVTASTTLLNKFHSGHADWTTAKLYSGAKVYFGLILSGDALVNDPVFRQQLLKQEPEAIGGEMEGEGLYHAATEAKVDWILVKAICDWADGNKNDEYQERAASNAAAFTLHVLQTWLG
jgi:nucleoside phosphorylase